MWHQTLPQGKHHFSCLWEGPWFALQQLLKTMQCFLGDPDSGCLNLEMHHLALAIAKKTLDENRVSNVQKTTNCPAPNFQVGERVYFKNKQPSKWDLKWRVGYRIVCIKHNRHYLQIRNQATRKTWSCNIKDGIHEPPVELWNVDTQFGTEVKVINHPTNLPTITLHNI